MTALILTLLILVQAPEGAVSGQIVSFTGNPAAGVRVYAIRAGVTVDGEGRSTVFEGWTQTDDAGNYRLQLPPGRFLIAAGSIDEPTYFPNTPDPSQARVVSVAAGSVAGSVDFTRFVPRRAETDNFPALQPQATGMLSGVLRFPDGSPAAGWTVTVVPTGTGSFPPAQLAPLISLSPTDAGGRYSIRNVPPGRYRVVAGYVEFQTFYPGTPDPTLAAEVQTTPATREDNLNFTVPRIPSAFSVGGRVSTGTGEAVPGSRVTLQPADRNAGTAATLGLPKMAAGSVDAGEDGTFQIPNVLAGSYVARVTVPGTRAFAREVVVSNGPIRDLQLALPLSLLSGKVLWEDGTPFTESNRLENAILRTSSDAPAQVTTIAIKPDGTFSKAIEFERFQFLLRALPQEYVIRSMTSGSADLLREPLVISSSDLTGVEIRIGRKNASDSVGGFKVSGRVRDGASGKAANASEIQLCCAAAGPFERLSAAVRPDGTFEFDAVPAGSYEASLRGPASLSLSDREINVVRRHLLDLSLTANKNLVPVTIRASVDGPAPVPAPFSVVFTSATGQKFPVRYESPNMFGLLPSGDAYTVEVSGLPKDYKVQSLTSGGSDILKGGKVLAGATASETGDLFIRLETPGLK